MAKTYLRTGRISWSPLTTAQQAMLANVNGIAIGSTFSATLDSPTETFLIGNGVISVPTSAVVASSGDTAGDVPVDNGDGTYSWTTPSGGSGSPTGAAGGDLAGTYPDPTVPGLATEATARAAADALLAPLASPALTGTPTAPTATALDNSTKLGTTAYADAAVLVEKTRALAAEGTNATAVTSEATTRASADTTEASARATADALLIPLTQKAAANGVASLDSGTKIPAAQLPASVVTDVSGSTKAIDSTGVTNGQGLIYDNASGHWKPGSGGGAATVVTGGSLGATPTLALASAPNVQYTGTLTANCALTITGLSTGCQVALLISQDGTGGRLLTVNGSAITVNAVPSSLSIVQLFSPDGVTLDILGPASAVPRGRALQSGGTKNLVIPGWLPSSAISTATMSANRAAYTPILIESQITIDALVFEVTTAVAASHMRMALYNADTNWQPTTLVAGTDTGSVSTAATGVISTAVGPTILPPGRYLIWTNLDTGNTVLRAVFGNPVNWLGYASALGTAPYFSQIFVAQTYGAPPSTGLAWSSISTTGAAGQFGAWTFLSVATP